MVGLADGPHRDGGNARLLADLVGQRGLVHAAVHRLLRRAHLAGRAIDHVGPGLLEGPCDQHRIGRRGAARQPILGRDAHRHRPPGRPGGAHRRKHLQRVAQAVVQAAAVRVIALVGQRGDEARQQIAVRAVQLQPVKTSVGGTPGGGHEVGQHAGHVGSGHRLRQRAVGQVGLRGGRDQRPVAAGQWLVSAAALPGRVGRSFGAGMAELQADGRIGVLVHMVDDALPGAPLVVVPQPRAAGRDAGVGRRAGHLGHHQRGAAHRPGPQMHQVVVAGDAVQRRILGHRRDDDPVFQRQAAHGVRREHRRRCGLAVSDLQPGAARKPALKVTQPLRIAQPQVLVADALAAGEHRQHELRRVQLIAIPRAAHLKPGHRVPGSVLQPQHVDVAQRLVTRQHGGDLIGRDRPGSHLTGLGWFGGIARLAKQPRQLDRVLDGQLGARADGKVRRVHRITHQHHMAAAIEQRPLLAGDALKVEPGRTAQVAGIAEQLFAFQVGGKQRLTEGDGQRGVGLVQPVGQPDVFGAFDDEGGGAGVKLVDMGLKPAVLGFLEQEGEGVIPFVRAQPDEAVGPLHGVGFEGVGVPAADAGVDAVAGNDQIGVGEIQVGFGLGLEHQSDADLLTARLQDVQQFFAADAHKAVAARAHHFALDVQLDVVPVVERLRDLRGGDRVTAPHVVHRGIGKHDTPAEGVVGLVALHHRDLVAGLLQLHQQAEVQAGRAATDADNVHGDFAHPPGKRAGLELNDF